MYLISLVSVLSFMKVVLIFIRHEFNKKRNKFFAKNNRPMLLIYSFIHMILRKKYTVIYMLNFRP